MKIVSKGERESKIARCHKMLHLDTLFIGDKGVWVENSVIYMGGKLGKGACLKTACARIISFQNCSSTKNEQGNLGFKIEGVIHCVCSSAVFALDYHHVDVM